MKVNLGQVRQKKNFFKLSNDSSFTAKYGEVLPISSIELVPDTHIKHSVRQGVRLAPLSLPTFGKSYLKTYYTKQKLSDIYPPFDNMLSQTPFEGSGLTYVPTSVPNVDPYFLLGMLLCNSTVSAYFVSSKFYDSVTSESSIFRTDAGQIHPVLMFNTTEYSNQAFAYGFIVRSIYNQLLNSGTTDVSYAKWANDLFLSLKDWSHQLAYGFDRTTQVSYVNSTDSDNVLQDRVNNLVTPNNCDYITTSIISSQVNSSSAFSYPYIDSSQVYSTHNFAQAEHGYTSSDKGMMFCWRLNNTGKMLRKILLGLGYQISCTNGKMSLLPLFGYYKSYFDIFAPKRFIKYTQTNCYKLINDIVQNNLTFYGSIIGYPNLTSASYQRYAKYGKIFSDFVTDLSRCYYTDDTDYYSSQIIGESNDYGHTLSQSYLGMDVQGDNYNGIISHSVEGVPQVNLNDSISHTQAQQNILSRLTNLVNRRSLLGGKIFDYLKSTFGIKSPEVRSEDSDNSYIGSDSLDVEFSDVFSTAETSEGSLGEYAGKSVAGGYSNGIQYDTDNFTIVITLGVIVPRTQYVQGIDPNIRHISYNDFYNKNFDGLTLIPSRRDEFINPQFNVFDKDVNSVLSFGNKPLYLEYKQRMQGVLNGDLSLNSTRNSYDSFTLDRVFTDRVFSDKFAYPDAGETPTATNLVFSYRIYTPYLSNVVAGTQWRYVGLYKQYGNFDRIFVNSGVVDNYDMLHSIGYDSNPYINKDSLRDYNRDDDNIIVHNIVDYSLNSPMLATADSYMTKDLEDLNNPNSDGMTVSAQ